MDTKPSEHSTQWQLIYRLAQAHARLMCHIEVEILDAVYAVILLETAQDTLMDSSSTVSATSLQTSFPLDPEDEYRQQAEKVICGLGLRHLWNKERTRMEQAADARKSCPLQTVEVAHASDENSPHQDILMTQVISKIREKQINDAGYPLVVDSRNRPKSKPKKSKRAHDEHECVEETGPKKESDKAKEPDRESINKTVRPSQKKRKISPKTSKLLDSFRASSPETSESKSDSSDKPLKPRCENSAVEPGTSLFDDPYEDVIEFDL